MKKLFAIVLALVMVLGLAACGTPAAPSTEPTTKPTTAPTTAPTTEPTTAPTQGDTKVMTHEEYMAAELNAPVCIETYVQAHQSWWDNKVTVYCQSPDGAYFVYELACSEEDAAKLTPGTKIRVNGFKGEWEGEIEVMDGTFQFVEGGDTWIAEAQDVTALLGTEELIDHQNEKVLFKGLTIENISFKNDGGDDIYVTVGYNGASYDFCVEFYLTGTDTEVYQAVSALKAGDKVDIEGFLYWYQGVNTHITAVTPAATVMTHEEYMAAEVNTAVCIETYVQAHQSWWDNKVTVYCQSPDGAYFVYELACSEEDAAKLTPGTKIRVNGFKGEWEGEIEIMDGTFQFVEGGDTWIAEAQDVTALLGTEELIDHQNEKVLFKGLTIENISFKNDGGDDIYVTVGYNGASYDFCVEFYLTGTDTEVYQAVSALKAGDKVDIEGFLYWYQGVNTHITAVTPAA